MKDKLKIMKGAHAAKRAHGSSANRPGSASAVASDTSVADRVRNAALATILAAGIVGAPYVTAVSAGAADESADTDKSGSNANEIKNKADSASMFKDETVYVFKKADGQNKNITVSDWLKNGDGDKTLSDVSDLKDIQNTEGNQAYTTGSKNQLTWAADGDDIYYQGSTSKKLPVDVKATYWLNGKKVTPDQISGKSGKVKIRYDYTNNSKVTENGYSVYTPFVAMTAVILDNDNFKNVKVTNAKMVNDGDRTTVVGYALPGMSDSLDLKDANLNIPEYVEVTADATDFTLSSSATYVTSDLFDGVDTDKMDTSQIGDKLNEMQDAMEQLMDGSNSLLDGLNQLAAGSDTLATGLKAAKTGTKQLSNGSDQVLSGLQQLRNGTSTSTGLIDAVNSIGTKSDTAKDGTLLGGANALSAGLTQLQTSADSGLESLEKQLKGASSSLKQISSGIDSYGKAANSALSDAQTQAGNIKDTEASDNSAQVNSDAEALNSSIDANKNLTDDEKASLKKQVAAMQQDGTVTSKATDNSAAVTQIQTDIKTAEGAIVGTGGLTSKIDTVASGLSQGADTVASQKTQLDSGIEKLKSGVKQVSDGLYSMKYGGKMADGRTSSGLQGAVDALGNKTTKNTLIYGANALSGGLASLLSASGTAADGAATLATNMHKAASGSAELSDGLKKFDDQAVKKLLNYYNDNLSGLTDRVDALVSAGKDYKNYSGISKDMDGQVKFIMEMDGINDGDDNGNSDSNSDSSDNGGTNDSGQNSSSAVAAVTESSDSNDN